MPGGSAYPSGHLVPSPIVGLACDPIVGPDSSNLPCLYSTFHLEYPLVLSRFCSYKNQQQRKKTCLVLGSSTAMCRLFLKNYTLTNKAVVTIWQPPQNHLIVSWDSHSLEPELGSRCIEHIMHLLMSRDIIYIKLFTTNICHINVYGLSVWESC